MNNGRRNFFSGMIGVVATMFGASKLKAQSTEQEYDVSAPNTFRNCTGYTYDPMQYEQYETIPCTSVTLNKQGCLVSFTVQS